MVAGPDLGGPKSLIGFWRLWGWLMQIALLMTHILLSIFLPSEPWLQESGFGNSDRQAEGGAGWRRGPPIHSCCWKRQTCRLLSTPLSSVRWLFLSSGCWLFFLCHGCTKFISDVTCVEMWFVLCSGPTQPEGQPWQSKGLPEMCHDCTTPTPTSPTATHIHSHLQIF